jgi:ribonuclease PH
MIAEFGWSKRADGSCLLHEQLPDKTEESAVLVAIHGPCLVKTKEELIDRATVQVVIQPLNFPPGGDSDAWAGKLERLLQESVVNVEEHPRTLIQVAVQPINIGTNFLSVMINAIFLSLLHAAVPLKRPFVAISNDPKKDIHICDGLSGRVLFQECQGALPETTVARAQIDHAYNELKYIYETATICVKREDEQDHILA